jgi:hypothetical protein
VAALSNERGSGNPERMKGGLWADEMRAAFGTGLGRRGKARETPWGIFSPDCPRDALIVRSFNSTPPSGIIIYGRRRDQRRRLQPACLDLP